MPYLSIVTLPHPVAGLKPEEVREKMDKAMGCDVIVKAITSFPAI